MRRWFPWTDIETDTTPLGLLLVALCAGAIILLCSIEQVGP